MPVPKFVHVVLTRFNVRYVEDPTAPSIGVDPAWLEERFSLFERYCLPTMLAQTEQDFRWIIFFDQDTPEPFAARARALAERRPGTVPVFCGDLPLTLVKQTVREALAVAPEWLLTTRLDNDDGLHPNFVASVQKAQQFRHAEVLNHPVGIILKRARAYRRVDPSNAFISLSEPFAEISTIFSIQRHIYAAESHPLRQISKDPMWLQVVHGGNISNRVRGWRIQAESVWPAFRLRAPEALPEEGAAGVLAENLTISLIRFCLDLGVAAARSILRAIGVEVVRKAPQPIGARKTRRRRDSGR